MERMSNDGNLSLDTRSGSSGSLYNNTFEGAIGNWIIQGTQDGTLNVSATQFGEVDTQGIPTWMGRVFHLTKHGNKLVAAGVIRAMITEQTKTMNQPANPTIFDPGQHSLSQADAITALLLPQLQLLTW
ncbi:MAG: hypothetical protein Q9202_002303 [Teloschistes flavicans]